MTTMMTTIRGAQAAVLVASAAHTAAALARDGEHAALAVLIDCRDALRLACKAAYERRPSRRAAIRWERAARACGYRSVEHYDALRALDSWQFDREEMEAASRDA